jgi:hypothetical protein
VPSVVAKFTATDVALDGLRVTVNTADDPPITASVTRIVAAFYGSEASRTGREPRWNEIETESELLDTEKVPSAGVKV